MQLATAMRTPLRDALRASASPTRGEVSELVARGSLLIVALALEVALNRGCSQ